jgi:hypothetical protein
MKDLIEKLEKATGPDRGLEYEMFAKLVEPILDHDPPYYTASIDDALTLVPEGAQWVVMSKGKTGSPPSAVVGARHDNGATSAIALCIAALKARIAVERDLTEVGK